LGYIKVKNYVMCQQIIYSGCFTGGKCYGPLKEYIIDNLDVLEKERDEQIKKQMNNN
jgi:hypothetical protein